MDKVNINLENKNSQNFHKNLKNIDINNDIDDDIRESNLSSINPYFMDPRESNIKESLLNSNINLEGKHNPDMNVEVDNMEEDEDKRISLNIAGHQLDQYFQKEGINKKDSKLNELSNSLKTINLEDENRNSQLIIDKNEDEEQKQKLGISYKSNNISRGNNKDGSKLLTLDDALKGSVHLSGKM